MTVPIHESTWSTAVPDWTRRIMSRESLLPRLPLHDAVAEKALRIFQRLRVPDIIDNPTYGEVCGSWVLDLVRAVFGSYDPETKRRALREFFLLVPKKNGKSSIAAAIMVTALIMNERPAAELLLIAPTIQIAEISFSQAAGIIRLDDELLKLFQVQQHLRRITHRNTDAVLYVKAAAPDVVTGSKAAYVLIDELHVFAMMSKAAEVMREIIGGLASRPDGFLLTITTQSKSPPTGVFKEKLAEARAVRDGRLSLPILPMLYELPVEVSRDGGWKDEATWELVNPNLGRSLDLEFLRAELVKAEYAGLEALALLASQHFNVEVGQSLHADNWPGAMFWADCADPTLSLDRLIDECDVAVAGVDGGGLDDLFALAVIGRHRETREWLHWAHAWAQPEVLERRKDIVSQLRDFERDGDLTICATVGQDVADAADICVQLRDAGLFPVGSPAIGLDAFGIAELLDALAERDFADDQLVSVGQGYKLQTAVQTLPRRLKDRRFRHTGSGLMRWTVGNAKQELRGSNWVVTKQTAGSAKIDPLMATFNAAMLMFGNPQSGGRIDDLLADPIICV